VPVLKDDLVFHSVFVEPEVDRAVMAHARHVGGTAGSAYRLFLDLGLDQLSRGVPLPSPVEAVPTLRLCGLRPEVYERLTAHAGNLRLEPAEFVMRLARMGMLAVHAAALSGEWGHRHD
jgi:hypothetical protein